ncbi:hypothetical protein HOY80DRAFT_1006036 [Tuber brumale]|nr:hypothetical protein HOY80DRAFT_1006036 [Tuber brumale]
MGGNSLKTNEVTKSPNYITEIGMASEQYYELKVYIKSIILPGAPAFECNHLGDNESKKAYHQWFNNALEEIGPRFFPQGGAFNGLRLLRYNRIYKAVHEIVQVLSIGIRKDYEKTDNLGVVERETEDCDEVEMVQDYELYDGESASDTDFEENDEPVDVEVAWGEKEDRMIVMGQNYKNRQAMEEGVEAAAIGLEDVLGLMKPEVFAHFSSLAEGCFDWDEVVGSISPESVSPPRFNARGVTRVPPIIELATVAVDLNRIGKLY